MPDAIVAPGETLVATIHAQGAQINECKAMPAASTLGSSGTDRYAAREWQDGGPALCGSDLGPGRRQRCYGQGRGQGPWRNR